MQRRDRRKSRPHHAWHPALPPGYRWIQRVARCRWSGSSRLRHAHACPARHPGHEDAQARWPCRPWAIRRLPGYASVPIVILTSSNDEKLRVAAPFAGPTTLIAKPFNATDFQRTIALLLGPSPADVGTVSRASEPAAFVWKRRAELPPLNGKPTELSEGRRVLNICRPLNGPRRH